MALTISHQIRRVYSTVDGAPAYEIDAYVTDAGDLPDRAVFVMQVPVPEDPKSDTLARVATVADLHDVVTDRPTALLSATDTVYAVYRTAQVFIRYTDLPTAVSALDVLKSRIDELVIDWQTYLNQFVAGVAPYPGQPVLPEDITSHPRYNSDLYTILLKQYLAALAAEAAAKATVDSTKTTYDAAVTTSSNEQAEVTEMKGLYDLCLLAQASVGAYSTSMHSFRTAANTYQAATTGTAPGPEATYVAAATAAQAAETAFDSSAACATMCAALYAEYQEHVTAKATADTAVATSRTNYESAKAAYVTAQQATEAALAAIVAIKPAFNPATDIPAGLTA